MRLDWSTIRLLMPGSNGQRRLSSLACQIGLKRDLDFLLRVSSGEWATTSLTCYTHRALVRKVVCDFHRRCRNLNLWQLADSQSWWCISCFFWKQLKPYNKWQLLGWLCKWQLVATLTLLLRRRLQKGRGKGGYGQASGLETCVQRQAPWNTNVVNCCQLSVVVNCCHVIPRCTSLHALSLVSTAACCTWISSVCSLPMIKVVQHLDFASSLSSILSSPASVIRNLGFCKYIALKNHCKSESIVDRICMCSATQPIRISCQRGFHRTGTISALLWSILTVPGQSYAWSSQLIL